MRQRREAGQGPLQSGGRRRGGTLPGASLPFSLLRSLPLRHRLPSFRPSNASLTFVPLYHLIRPSLPLSLLPLSSLSSLFPSPFPPPRGPSRNFTLSPPTGSPLPRSASSSEGEDLSVSSAPFLSRCGSRRSRRPKQSPHPDPHPEG